MALVDEVQQHLGSSEINQISQQLGISPGMAQTAIAAAIPMIVGGMAGHASQPQGATSIQDAVAAHDGVTDNIPNVLQAGPPADVGGGSGGLLGRILGGHRDPVQQGVQQADPGQLGGVLHQEAQTAAQQSPHVGGLLGKILGAVQSPRA